MKPDTNLTEWIIEQRRYLHTHPELSHQEKETKTYITSQLHGLGIETYSITGKDVIGIIKGDHPGKTVAIRSDMDALPILEETGLPFSSVNNGVMHACGHDGHMSILLGIARLLVSNKSAIHGTIHLLFQHAEEEVPGGAVEIVGANGLNNIEAIFGYHLWQPLKSGLIGVRQGPTMAGADRFIIRIFGKGGHGSMPEETIDPTLVISQIITQLHTIVSRSIKAIDQAVISIGELHSGTSYNVIPDTAFASGTVRYFNKDTSLLIEKRIEDIIAGVCKSFGATYELDYIHGDPPVLNDKALTAFIQKTAISLFGEEKVVEIDPILGSEDFSYYSHEIPASFTFIGVGKEDTPYGHHHPKFDIDEDMLPVGVELFTTGVLNYLRGGNEDEN
ncbi:M20 metallopeptidase family protein [Psychrobacillus vulpis]|uniref:Amidohydrolase n=1 Tax=Psychrobacillus vulpis TaxID=2325572 RepID=A0A544TV33_9BACI|nr:amidohydrolase [Psychrobacillus vulpis]TQR21305.1 amidohydrolase [Psychrobacillus vulpis]